MQTPMKFDQRYVFERLPLSDEQKLALIKTLMRERDEKKETVDPCPVHVEDNDTEELTNACDDLPPPPRPCHLARSITNCASRREDEKSN